MVSLWLYNSSPHFLSKGHLQRLIHHFRVIWMANVGSVVESPLMLCQVCHLSFVSPLSTLNLINFALTCKSFHLWIHRESITNKIYMCILPPTTHNQWWWYISTSSVMVRNVLQLTRILNTVIQRKFAETSSTETYMISYVFKKTLDVDKTQVCIHIYSNTIILI